MKKGKINYNSGQTLIILIVLATFVVLGSVIVIRSVLQNYQNMGNVENIPNPTSQSGPIGVVNRALDIEIKSDISQLSSALEQYRMDNQKYPLSLNDLAPTYIAVIKKNPSNHLDYEYQRVSDNNYILSTSLTTGEKYTKNSP